MGTWRSSWNVNDNGIEQLERAKFERERFGRVEHYQAEVAFCEQKRNDRRAYRTLFQENFDKIWLILEEMESF